jgi:hypothetical protein
MYFHALFEVIRHQELGKRIKELLETYPISDANFLNRATLTKWVWNLRKECADICGDIWSFEDLDKIMNGKKVTSLITF